MLNNFKSWLSEQGFAAKTHSGRESTCYSYVKGVLYICDKEQLNINQLADKVFEILPMYQKGGLYETRGRQISRSVRCGLSQFSKFILEQRA